MLQEAIHRSPTGKQHQHPEMLLALHLLAKIGRHLGNVLLFVIHQRFITHLRNNNFPLLHVVERRIQRHEAVTRFFLQAAHLLQAREAVKRAQRR